MYQDISGKIKVWAQIWGVLSIICGILCAIIFFIDWVDGHSEGWLVWVSLLSGFAGYMSSCLLYGFGQHLDDLHDCKEYLRFIHEKQDEMQSGSNQSASASARAIDNEELPDL